MAIEISADSGVEFVERSNGTHDPALIHGFGKSSQLLGEQSVAQGGLRQAGSEFEEIGEEAVKDTDLIFEGRVAILGKGRSVGEKLSEALTAGRALKDAKGVAATLRGNVHVHFEREPGAAFSKLCGKLQVGGFASGFLFEDGFDFGLRERSKIELETPGNDGGEKGIGRWRGQDERGAAGRFFQDFEEDVGDVPAHGFSAIENEDPTAAHRLKVGGALDGAKLADSEHRARDGIL